MIFSGGAAVHDLQPVRVAAGRLLAEIEAVADSPTFKPPKAYKPTTTERFRDLPPAAVGLLATPLALDPAAPGSAAQALQSSFFSTLPLLCDLSELPVVYKEEVADPAACLHLTKEGSEHGRPEKAERIALHRAHELSDPTCRPK
ncbi:unnamed protein product [Urochloa humidicola]